MLLGGAILAIMIWTHPKLTAMAMIPMPALVFFTRHLGKKMHDFHTTAQESFSRLTEMIRESFFGIRIIKVFNFETLVINRVGLAATDYFQKNLKRAVVTALLRPLLGFFFNISSLIILFYGGFLVMHNTLSPGELVAFLQYLGLLAWPVIAIGWMTNLFQRGLSSLHRINALLESKPGIICPKNPVPMPRHIRHFRFNRTGFTYDGHAPILADICLEIPVGKRLGITGPPGSGKTTLAYLMTRLYDPSQGDIRVNDISTTDMDPEILRSRIAFMPQEPFLFSTTLKDNILMGRDMAEADLEKIIRICDLSDTIEAMPLKLETLVGERGVTLSGGQKQRLALARALVENKPVLILDDPVSQLDTQTARRVINGIHRFTVNRTCIIISHRLSALADCDFIHILENGRIQASGAHARLLEKSRYYRHAFEVQQFEET